MARMAFIISGADRTKSTNTHTPGFPEVLKAVCQPSCNFQYGYPQNGKTLQKLVSDIESRVTYAGTKFTDGDNKYLFAFKENINNPDSESPTIKELQCYVYYEAPNSLDGKPLIGVESCQ